MSKVVHYCHSGLSLRRCWWHSALFSSVSKGSLHKGRNKGGKPGGEARRRTSSEENPYVTSCCHVILLYHCPRCLSGEPLPDASPEASCFHQQEITRATSVSLNIQIKITQTTMDRSCSYIHHTHVITHVITWVQRPINSNNNTKHCRRAIGISLILTRLDTTFRNTTS